MISKDTDGTVGFPTLTGTIKALSTIGMDSSTARRHVFLPSHGDS